MSAGAGDLRPLVVKELRLLSRSRFAFWGLFFMLAGIGAGVFIFWMNSGQQLSLNQRASFSRGLFYTVGSLLLVFLGLISTMITAISFSDERERKTFDMLLCTGISPRRLIMGKWLGAMTYQLMLVICLLPILTVVFQFGGVGAQEFIGTAGLLVVTTGTYGMLGLSISAANDRSLKSLAKALGWVIGLMFGSNLMCCLSFVVSPLASFMFLAMPGPTTWLMGVHFGFQLLIFLILLRRGQKELARPEKLMVMLTREQMTKLHADMMAWQRRTFPYNVTYPFYVAPPIPDGKSALYIHEKRQALRAHQALMLKLGGVGMLLTMFVPFFDLKQSPEEALRIITVIALAYMALLMPIAAATALTSEHENGTLNLLMTAPISEWGVVWSKFRAALRLMAVTWCIAMVPGVVVVLAMLPGIASFFTGLAKLAPLGLAYLGLYAAVGILMSSLCRRNVAALATSILAGGVMLLLPALASVAHEIMLAGSEATPISEEFEPIFRVPISLFSPLLLLGLVSPDNARFNTALHIIFQMSGIIAVTLICLRGAAWKLARRSAG